MSAWNKRIFCCPVDFSTRHRPYSGWYRGIVRGFDQPHNVKVFYIDYGTSRTVPLKQARYLHHSFWALHAQAIPAKLSGVRPIDGEWQDEATIKMTNFATSTSRIGGCTARIDGVRNTDDVIFIVRYIRICIYTSCRASLLVYGLQIRSPMT